MKKLIIICLSLFLVQISVKADDKIIIQFTDLPTKAQEIITTNFDKSKLALIKKEPGFFNSYEVTFSDGTEIEFDNGGDWEDIDCKYTALPDGVIPPAIKAHIVSNYPDAKAIKIEKDRSEIEVTLSNGLELIFNSNYKLIEIDN